MKRYKKFDLVKNLRNCSKKIKINLVDLQTQNIQLFTSFRKLHTKKHLLKERKIMQNGKYIVLNSAMDYFLKGIIKTSQRHNVNRILNTFINFKGTCTQNV